MQRTASLGTEEATGVMGVMGVMGLMGVVGVVGVGGVMGVAGVMGVKGVGGVKGVDGGAVVSSGGGGIGARSDVCCSRSCLISCSFLSLSFWDSIGPGSSGTAPGSPAGVVAPNLGTGGGTLTMAFLEAGRVRRFAIGCFAALAGSGWLRTSTDKAESDTGVSR